ncbi:MAG: ribonuclease HII [Anaerolineales bacterium]|nr:ribonuclease HII [Anaerolineales bacterium]MCS7248278.1 ribonuclease HII [Anaerolineales bacterium]MDW8162092.1 ribonuclease HII [Anaerolineales bacterium]MDW8447419.1 ribonuclease HII [Anaerolineales bacterium]
MRKKTSGSELPSLEYELELWQRGIGRVVGMDEAGRGALAGPVAVGAVCFPPDPLLSSKLYGVRDSKQLRPAERACWAEQIQRLSLAWAVGFASNEEIDQLGIGYAVRLAAYRALADLPFAPQHLLIDYFRLPECEVPQTALIKGDQRSLTIAAASILAKTARDRWMGEADALYPQYGFAAHKGYATTAHLELLRRWGASPLHRRSFDPVSQIEEDR